MKRLKIRLRIISSVLQDVITGRSKCGLSLSCFNGVSAVQLLFDPVSLFSVLNGFVIASIPISSGTFSDGFELLVLSGFFGLGCGVVSLSAFKASSVQEVDIECSSRPLKTQLAAITKLRVSITSKKLSSLTVTVRLAVD